MLSSPGQGLPPPKASAVPSTVLGPSVFATIRISDRIHERGGCGNGEGGPLSVWKDLLVGVAG